MKSQKIEHNKIYRIRNTENGCIEGSYSKACHTEYNFISPLKARNSNIHGIFKDKEKYKIEEYEVTYRLINESVD